VLKKPQCPNADAAGAAEEEKVAARLSSDPTVLCRTDMLTSLLLNIQN
jgi:hypothetical protein